MGTNKTMSIEEILRGNFKRAEELVNTNTNSDFTAKDGIIEFTGYSGKKGILAKSAIAYVVAYLEAAPIKGVEIIKLPAVTKAGKAYFKIAFKYNKSVKADEVIALFDEVVASGRKIYNEMNNK